MTRETNLAGLVRRWAQQAPDVEALVEASPVRRCLTWAALDARVDAVASGLAARGLVAGHRVALRGGNRVELVVAYLAVLRAGFVAVPLDPRLPASEVDPLLRRVGARLLLADEDAEPVPDVATEPLTPDGLDRLAAAGAGPVDSPPDGEALAALLWTAGTSGPPRAAMLTHRALLAHLQHVDALGVVGPGETVLGVLPLFHVFGLNAVLGGWLVAGARLVLGDSTSEAVFTALASERVQHLPLSPAFLVEIAADERAGSLAGVSVISGAAPLSSGLAAEFVTRTGATLDQGYGLTEAAGGVSLTTTGLRPVGGHVGRPLPGVEVRIGDGSEEPGEIAVRGANLFSGYWPDGADGPGTDGWFATGDIGYLDDDGELFLLERARELVVVDGFAVYPAEVEQVVAALPGVVAVAVVGVPVPSGGDRLVAFVVGEVQPARVLEHCGRALVRFKQPSQVELVPELPRGATGKVRKGVLRDRLQGAR